MVFKPGVFVVMAALMASGCTDTASTVIESTVLTPPPEEVVGDVGEPDQAATVNMGGETDAGVSSPLSPPTTSPMTSTAGLTGEVPLGSTLRTTTTLNLRTGPGTNYSVRLVLPEAAEVQTVNVTAPDNGWYNVSYSGVAGWSSGKYLALIDDPATEPGDRAAAISRARSGVGFSYWWGHGRWVPSGATSSVIGACTGSCPNCTHSGNYGADCSGYLGKIWQVPSSNTDPQIDSHPYSTFTFNGSNSQWSTVNRGAVRPADALVYNQNGAGHIFLYESGDGWGSMWAYEARGCSYGIVHNLRTASSAFHAIARTGY